METLEYFPNFPNFYVPKFGKFGKLESLENIHLLLKPLWVTVLSLVQAKGNKDDRSAQAVQDEASLSPAALRAGFSMVPRPQVGNVHRSHSVAATIRPPEVRMTAITREWLSWDDYSDKSGSEGTFQRKYSQKRCAPESTDIYYLLSRSLNIMSVGLFLWGPTSEKKFKLSRGVLRSKTPLRVWSRETAHSPHSGPVGAYSAAASICSYTANFFCIPINSYVPKCILFDSRLQR